MNLRGVLPAFDDLAVRLFTTTSLRSGVWATLTLASGRRVVPKGLMKLGSFHEDVRAALQFGIAPFAASNSKQAEHAVQADQGSGVLR
jgi:hypothetical protein